MSDANRWTQRAQRGLIAVWVFCLVLAVFPTEQAAIQSKLLATGVIAVLVTLLWAGDALLGKRPQPVLTPGMQVLAGFLLVHLVAALATPHRAAALYAMYPWILFAILSFAAGRLYARSEHVEQLLAVIAGSIAVSSVYGIVQHLGWDPFPWAEVDRLEYTASPSTYGNPNFAGHALVFGIVLALGLAARKGRRWWLVPALLMAGHLYLTQMRSAPLALGLAAILLLLFAGANRLLKRPLLAASLVLALLAGLGATALYQVHQRIPLKGTLPIDSSLILRLNSLHTGATLALEHPFIGSGPGGYARESMAHWTPFQQRWFVLQRQRGEHVHCDMVEAAVEAGAPGAFFYLALMLWPILQSLRMAGSTTGGESRRIGYVLAALFAAYAVDGLFGFNLRVPVSAGLFLLLYGVLDGMQSPTREVVKRREALSALGALAMACVCAVVGARAFEAAYRGHYARGAMAYAQESEQEVQRDFALDEAEFALGRSAELLPWERSYAERLGELALLRDQPAVALAHFERALARDPLAPELHLRIAQAHISLADAEWRRGHSVEEGLQFADAALDAADALCSRVPEVAEARARAAFLRAEAAQEGANRESFRETAAFHARRALEDGLQVRVGIYVMLANLAHAREDWPDALWAVEHATAEDWTREANWELFQRIGSDAGALARYLDALQGALAKHLALGAADMEVAESLATRVAGVFPRVEGNPPRVPHAVALVAGSAQGNLDLWGAVSGCFLPEQRLDGLRALLPVLDVEETPSPIRVLLDGIAESDAQVDTGAYLVRIARELPLDTPQQTSDRAFGWLAELLEQHLDPDLSAPVRARTLSFLGEVYTAAGRWEDACRVLEIAAPRLDGGERANALLHHSKALAGLGEKEAALASAREAAAGASNPIMARWNLAQRLVDAGKHAEARIEYRVLMLSSGVPAQMRTQMQAEVDALLADQGEPTP